MTVALAAVLVLAACAQPATQPPVGFGPNPQLPQPQPQRLPTVNIAPALGWPAGGQPRPADGLSVQAFAAGLDHPRWMLVLPNGDVLVAETNAPPRLRDGGGLVGWFMRNTMARAGARSASANRITLLRDADRDGVAETRSVLLQGLNSPFGMALVGDQLYVAEADALRRFPYRDGDMRIDAPGTKVIDLPGGPINHHWTKNLIASRDGSRLYVAVGSNSNIGERGMDQEAGRAAIWEVDAASGAHRVLASGLRNPVGMDWEPRGGLLCTVVNERDALGDDLVPDYLTSVTDGAFYGWPYSYFGAHVDARVQPPRPDLVARAIAPDYALGAHTASLGLAFSDGRTLSPAFAQGAFIGQHGSWNRRPHSGYKVVFVPFDGAKPAGLPVDVLTGFLSPDGEAWGRPVGVVLDRRGGLLVADDVGNVIWRVGPASGAGAAAARP